MLLVGLTDIPYLFFTADLISELQGEAFTGERNVEEEGTFFKVRRITHIKLQNFDTVLLQITVVNYHYDISRFIFWCHRTC